MHSLIPLQSPVQMASQSIEWFLRKRVFRIDNVRKSRTEKTAKMRKLLKSQLFLGIKIKILVCHMKKLS